MLLSGDVANLISNVGFPIFTFIALAWFIYFSYNKSIAMYEKSLDKIGALTEAVNSNTQVLTDIVKKLDKSDDI